MSVNTTEKKQRSSTGRSGFISRYKLWTATQREAAKRLKAKCKQQKIRMVRTVYCDQHGLLRGKALPLAQFFDSLENGVATSHASFAMDSANHIYLPVFSADGGFGVPQMGGGGDMLLVPDPTTFKCLPWLDNTGWVLCDLYLKDGSPLPLSTRAIAQRANQQLGAAGHQMLAGLEIEFHVFRISDPKLTMADSGQPPEPPEVTPISHAYQYHSELKLDEASGFMDMIGEQLVALGLPLRSLEDEWGPGQCEITLEPLPAMQAADAMVLMRGAIKQLARRQGLLATFMCKPALPNIFSSGWHLHQSLVDKKGNNQFVTRRRGAVLSATGQQFVGGLLANTSASCAFSNPTINGYKRLNETPLAPKRAVWSVDNKGAMLRLVGGGDDPGTHIENRVGEPAANPYLFIASQIVAGLDGLQRKLDPGPAVIDPSVALDAPLLPTSLMESIAALQSSGVYREAFGEVFINYFIGLKQQEIGRFLSAVTDWEHREYFEHY